MISYSLRAPAYNPHSTITFLSRWLWGGGNYNKKSTCCHLKSEEDDDDDDNNLLMSSDRSLHCTMCSLLSTIPLYLKWPCLQYKKKKGWIQGHILGEIPDLEFEKHTNVKKCILRILEQAGTTICSMGYQNSNFKIGLSLFGCAQKYTQQIAHCALVTMTMIWWWWWYIYYDAVCACV